jgi:hypothetical protein
MDFDEFIYHVQNRSSDLYLLPMILLYSTLPCSQNILRLKRCHRLRNPYPEVSNKQVGQYAAIALPHLLDVI